MLNYSLSTGRGIYELLFYNYDLWEDNALYFCYYKKNYTLIYSKFLSRLGSG